MGGSSERRGTRMTRAGILLAAGLTACGGAPSSGTPAGALRRIGDDFWAEQMRNSPVWATFLGDRSRDAELDEVSEAAIQRHLAEVQALSARLDEVDRDA